MCKPGLAWLIGNYATVNANKTFIFIQTISVCAAGRRFVTLITPARVNTQATIQDRIRSGVQAIMIQSILI